MGGIESPVSGVSGIDKDSYKEEKKEKEEKYIIECFFAMLYRL